MAKSRPIGILLLCALLLGHIALGIEFGGPLVARLPAGPPLGLVESALIGALLAAPIAALPLLVALWQHHRHGMAAYVIWACLTWLQLLSVLYLSAGLLGVRNALTPLLVVSGTVAAVLFYLIGRYLKKVLQAGSYE